MSAADGDDFDFDRPRPLEKKVRFPKKKQPKSVRAVRTSVADGEASGINPERAAKERARRRNDERETEVLRYKGAESAPDELQDEDNDSFDDDGIRMEPFNMEQEKEEGYFDDNGNFFEYVIAEVKDAWLDSAEVERFTGKKIQETVVEEDYQDLLSEDVGKIKRNIADVLQPGENIIHALKRLKGADGDMRGKMSQSTKLLFDKLTEDAMKLLENGEYNVYHEKRETFVREAEGYERLAQAKDGLFSTADGPSENVYEDGIALNGINSGHTPSSSTIDGPPGLHTLSGQVSSDDGCKFDMFGDDDEDNDANLQLASGVSGPAEGISKPTDENGVSSEDKPGEESDYVYDNSSGYYYSSSLGYYYDPSSQLYCSESSGKWYSFDEGTGSYMECQAMGPTLESDDAVAVESDGAGLSGGV